MDTTFNNLSPIESSAVHFPKDDARKFLQVEAAHFWFTHRRDLILGYLQEHLGTSGKGLDLGCGSGYTTEWLAEKGYAMVGIDAYAPPITQKPTLAFFQSGDIFSISPQAEFDFVLLLDVLEHIPNDKVFLERAFEFLKPGGLLLMTVPAFEGLWTSIDDHAGHLRRYTLKTAHAILPPNNKTIVSTYFFFMTFPLYLLSRVRWLLNKKKPGNSELTLSPLPNLICGALCFLERLLLKFVSLPLGSSLLLLLRKS